MKKPLIQKKIEKSNIEDIYSLTPSQNGILFHYLKNKESNQYFEQLYLDLEGVVNIELFIKAFKIVVQSNEMLRAIFRWKNINNPVQIILKNIETNFIYNDDYDNEGDNHEIIDKLKKIESDNKLDIEHICYRISLYKTNSSKYLLILSFHHIIIDGWSLGIILKELFKNYSLLLNEQSIPLLRKKTYKNFVKWVNGQDCNAQEQFWKNYFQQFNKKLTENILPINNIEKKIETINFNCEPALQNDIDILMKYNSISLSSLIYGIWSIFLHQLLKNEFIEFDITTSGRNVKINGVEEIVGLFINTLPFRYVFDDKKSFIDVINDIKGIVNNLTEHSHDSAILIDKHNFHVQSIFDSLIVIENYPLNKTILSNKESGFVINSVSFTENSKYNLLLIVSDFESLNFQLNYDSNLFNTTQIENLVCSFKFLIKQVISYSTKPIRELESASSLNGLYNDIVSQPQFQEDGTEEYVQPTSQTEIYLAEIWSDIFKKEKELISTTSNFFKLGGDSIKASGIISHYNYKFGIKIPFEKLFQFPTIEQLAKFINSKLKDKNKLQEIKFCEKKEYYKTSSAQKRMFYQQELDSKTVSYNCPIQILLEGDLEPENIKTIFQKLIQKHESLRTWFTIRDKEIVQVIEPETCICFKYHELGDKNINDLFNEFIKPFDLSKASLIRIQLTKIQSKKYILFMDIHHIISDFVSMQIFAKDFMKLIDGKKIISNEIQYKDYSEWQNNWFKTLQFRKQEEYWLNQFKSDTNNLKLLYDFPKPKNRSLDKGELKVFYIAENLKNKLEKEVFQSNSTIFIYLLTVYNVLLFKYTNQNDIIVGSTVEGRNHPELKNILGMFVNILPLRNYPKGNLSYKDFHNEVRKNSLTAFENQVYPYDLLIQNLNRKSQNELFTTEFAMNNNEEAEISLSNLKMKLINNDIRFAKYDLHFQVSNLNDKIKIILRYSTELFAEKTINRIITHYLEILEQSLENNIILLNDIKLSHTYLSSSASIDSELTSEIEL